MPKPRSETGKKNLISDNLIELRKAHILRQLHPNSRILLMANFLSFVTYSPQNPPVLLPLETVCLAWDSPFPASAVAKGITH